MLNLRALGLIDPVEHAIGSAPADHCLATCGSGLEASQQICTIHGPLMFRLWQCQTWAGPADWPAVRASWKRSWRHFLASDLRRLANHLCTNFIAFTLAHTS